MAGDALLSFAQHQLSPDGFIGSELEDGNNRKKNRLLLQLKSAEIEKELQAKMRMDDYQRFDPSISAKLGANANVALPNDYRMDEKEASALNASRKVDAYSARAGMPARPQARITNKGNKKVVIFIDPNTREVVGEKELGPSDAAYGKAQEAEANFADLDQTFGALRNMASKVLASGNRADAAKQGLKTRWQSFSQTNSDASDFMRLRETFAKSIARAVEKGIVTQQDYEAILHAIPDEFDTIETAESQLQAAQDKFEAAKDAKVRTYLNGPNAKEDKPKGKKPVSDAAKKLAQELLGK